MATYKPLVLVGGQPRELPAGDTLAGIPAAGGSANPDAAINGFVLATDQLVDLITTGGMANGQAYFHQVVAGQTATVVGMAFRITRSGSVVSGWVGLFNVAGNVLAAGTANQFMGTEGWKKALFTAPYTIQAGTRYILGIVAGGDNVPGFLAAPGLADYNQNIAAMPLRSFRKSSVSTLNANQDFTVNTFANSDPRLFLSLVTA